LPPVATAATWHVLPDGTGDAPTIQAAVDSSASGDSILVAAGTYLENVVLEPGRLLIGSWDDAFAVSDVAIHPTTVDGDSSGPCITADFLQDDPLGRISGFRLIRGSGRQVSQWIRHGGGLYAIGLGNITDLVVEDCEAENGAGLYVEAEYAELSDIIARLNTLPYGNCDGGGLYLAAGSEGRVTRSHFEGNVRPLLGRERGAGAFVRGPRVQIDSCTITRNGHWEINAGSLGCGVFSDCDSLILLDCEITKNQETLPPDWLRALGDRTSGSQGARSAAPPEGALGNPCDGWAAGGGVYARTARIERCLISRNAAFGRYSGVGGGVFLESGLIVDCTIEENAAFGWDDGSGGGIWGGEDLTILGCTIVRNWGYSGVYWGAGAGIDAATLRIENATVGGNWNFGGHNASSAGIRACHIEAENITVADNWSRAGDWGTNETRIIVGIEAESGFVRNSILSNNTYSGPTPQVTGGLGGAIESRHNLFHGNTGDPHWGLTVAEAHVYVDPLFADSTFHLALHSPAIDRGDPAILDPDGSVADLGAWGGPAGTMERPSRVLGLEALRTPAGNSLTWDANPEPGIGGYAVYRLPSAGTHPGLETFVGSTTQTWFTDPVGPPYPDGLYRVSAYDAGRRGGGYSDAVAPVGNGPVRREALAPPGLRRLGANPARGAVTFEVRAPASAPARMQVFDIRGRRVWSRSQPVPAGISELRWPALDEFGHAVSSGIYFVQVDFAGESYRQKVVVMK
jgi:hypothetical protein